MSKVFAKELYLLHNNNEEQATLSEINENILHFVICTHPTIYEGQDTCISMYR